ncbi:MAG: beta-ketoacyl-ACP synthase III [Alphaproteobacteria bacterium]|nr:beta-ketoacyl-ACP synthase III [Alphaproteobacteria bacterium]
MTEAVISGTGLYTPPHAISNEELVVSFNAWVERMNALHAADIAAGRREPLQPSNVDFIVKASGIRSRFVVEKQSILDPEVMVPSIPERPNEELSILAEIAIAAAREAIARADIAAGEIDAVICACSNLQRAYPAIAIEVQAALGAGGFAFDMNVACSSATFGIQTGADMIRTGSARKVLMVNPEICTGHLNFRDRDSHFIFGDVATAVVLERADDARSTETFDIVSTRLITQFSNNIRNNFGFLNRAAPEGVGARDKLFVQEGRKVFKEVVPLVSQLILEHLGDNQIPASALKRLWLHQANANMNDLISRKVLGRDPVPGEAPVVLDTYANTSSAGSIIAFHKHRDGLAAGDVGLICSFGAGYSAGSVIVRKR